MNSLKAKLKALWKRLLVRRIAIAVIIVLSVVLLELFISNVRLAFVDKEDYLTDYEPMISPVTVSSKAGNFSFRFPSSGVYAIKIETKTETGDFEKPVRLYIKAYDEKRSDSLITVKSDYIAPGEEKLIFLDYNGVENSYIRLEFADMESEVILEGITVNPSQGLFRFNFLRAAIVLLIAVCIWLVKIFGFDKESFDIAKTSHRVAAIATVLLCITVVVLYCVFFVGIDYPYNYPLVGEVQYYNPYIQQFDAFLKGQLHIDYPVNEEILDLDNPYDHGQREGLEYLWDRAMYDGKYYSYFGIAPILNIYYPSYLFTKTVASDGMVKTVYAIMATLFACASLYAYVVIYKKRVSVSLLSLFSLALTVCSGVMLMARSTAHFYYIPVIAAMSYLAGFIFFIMLAVNSKHKVARPILFALTGLNYAFLFLSRVNMALLTAFIVLPILYFGVIKGKPSIDKSSDVCVNRTLKGKITDLICLGVPVLMAGIFTMIYNNARFGSPFEFGAKYQLTVSDVSKNSIDFSSLTQMLYHSFIQPFKVSGNFPFFSLQYENMNNYGGYLYVDSGMGLFAIPLMLALFLGIALLKSKRKTPLAKSLFIALVIGVSVVSVMNFYIGGVIYRYTADMTLLCAFAAILLIISFNESLEESEAKHTVLVLEKTFLVISVFVCACVLVSLHGYLENVSANTFVTVYEMFS